MTTPEFVEFPKMARLSREVIITEKLDGTNAQIFITEEGGFYVGSRTRWITPEADNYGFAAWAYANKADLMNLGPGSHFGEWWGAGIQRKYNTGEKRFSLFNVSRWGATEGRPACCHVVPTLYVGDFTTDAVEACIARLRSEGSVAAPGFMNPEGVVVFHTAGRVGFKKTLHKDEVPKALANAA
jgi:hypothetical protein